RVVGRYPPSAWRTSSERSTAPDLPLPHLVSVACQRPAGRAGHYVERAAVLIGGGLPPLLKSRRNSGGRTRRWRLGPGVLEIRLAVSKRLNGLSRLTKQSKFEEIARQGVIDLHTKVVCSQGGTNCDRTRPAWRARIRDTGIRKLVRQPFPDRICRLASPVRA